jgi:Uncharacterized conserved protein
MIRILLIAMALLLSVPFAVSAELQQANNTATHLTVYDAGIAEFLEERTVELQSGMNTVVWRSLMPKTYIETIRITAENADIIQQHVSYDGGEVRNEKSPVLHITLQNKATPGPQRLQVDYLAPDVTWRNDYSLMLDQTAEGEPATAALLDSWVTIFNRTGTDISAGTVDLVAGELSLQLGDNRYRPEAAVTQNFAMNSRDGSDAESSVEASSISAFSRFRLGHGIAMNANTPVNRFPLFQKARLAIAQRNIFENPHNTQTLARGGFILLPRGLEVRLVARNTTGRAIPAGLVTVYTRSDNLTQVVGQDRIGFTPANGDFGITQGKSSTLYGTRRVVERRMVRYKTADDNTREKLVTKVEVILTNRSALVNEAFIREGVEPYDNNQWAVIESSAPYEKLGANSLQFKVQVPATGKVTVTYTVETK